MTTSNPIVPEIGNYGQTKITETEGKMVLLCIAQNLSGCNWRQCSILKGAGSNRFIEGLQGKVKGLGGQ